MTEKDETAIQMDTKGSELEVDERQHGKATLLVRIEVDEDPPPRKSRRRQSS